MTRSEYLEALESALADKRLTLQVIKENRSRWTPEKQDRLIRQGKAIKWAIEQLSEKET